RRLQHPADGIADDRGASARVRSRNAPVRASGGRRPQHPEDRSRLGARAVLGRRQLARRGLRGLLQGHGQYEQVPRRPRAQDARADESALRRARELRLHRRAAAPHVASGGDPGPLAADLRRDLLVLHDVRQHGASVEIEPDVGCDARFGQRLDRACDLSDPRVQQTLYRLDPRLARPAGTGDPRPRPARCRRRHFAVKARTIKEGGSPMAHYKILSDEEIRAALADLPDWSLKAPNIEATFALKTFRDAIAFIVEIAVEAEVMNHHPEFHNSYNTVCFSFCTHDAGMKITDLDIETARKISALAK